MQVYKHSVENVVEFMYKTENSSKTNSTHSSIRWLPRKIRRVFLLLPLKFLFMPSLAARSAPPSTMRWGLV